MITIIAYEKSDNHTLVFNQIKDNLYKEIDIDKNSSSECIMILKNKKDLEEYIQTFIEYGYEIIYKEGI